MAARSLLSRLSRFRITNTHHQHENTSPVETSTAELAKPSCPATNTTQVPSLLIPAYTPHSCSTPSRCSPISPRYFSATSATTSPMHACYFDTLIPPPPSCYRNSECADSGMCMSVPTSVSVTRTVSMSRRSSISRTIASLAAATEGVVFAATEGGLVNPLPFGRTLYADSEGSLGAEAMATLNEEDLEVYVEQAFAAACEELTEEPGKFWIITREQFYADESRAVAMAANSAVRGGMGEREVGEWVEGVSIKRPELIRRNATWPWDLEEDMLKELEDEV